MHALKSIEEADGVSDPLALGPDVVSFCPQAASDSPDSPASATTATILDVFFTLFAPAVAVGRPTRALTAHLKRRGHLKAA
jgi:hypothetical protein